MVVKPERSAKSTVTQRRSSLLAVTCSRERVVVEGDPLSRAPHSAQNLLLKPFGAPQAGHRSSSLVPHSAQNFAPLAFSWLHVGHRIWLTPEVVVNPPTASLQIAPVKRRRIVRACHHSALRRGSSLSLREFPKTVIRCRLFPA